MLAGIDRRTFLLGSTATVAVPFLPATGDATNLGANPSSSAADCWVFRSENPIVVDWKFGSDESGQPFKTVKAAVEYLQSGLPRNEIPPRSIIYNAGDYSEEPLDWQSA